MTGQRRGSLPGAPLGLLHPVDFSPARRYYLFAMFLQLAASPAILAAAILFLLTISANLLSPLIGPIIGLTVTSYVERRYRADAWAHIARKAQDLTRPDPAPWAQAGLVLQVLLLGMAAAGLIGQTRREVLAGAPSLGAGVLGGLVLVQIAVLLWDRGAPVHTRSSGIGTGWRHAHAGGVLFVSAVSGASLLGLEFFHPVLLAAGMLVTGVVSLLWYVMRLIPASSSCVPKSFPLP